MEATAFGVNIRSVELQASGEHRAASSRAVATRQSNAWPTAASCGFHLRGSRNVTTVPDLTPSRQPPSCTAPATADTLASVDEQPGWVCTPLGGERKAGWRTPGYNNSRGGDGGWEHHRGCTLATLRQRMTAWRAGLGVWLARYHTPSHPLQLATVNLLLTPHSELKASK